MDFFDRHKALIITTLFCSVLVLALYNLSLSSRNRETGELLVNLENFKIEEKAKEEIKQEETEQKIQKPSAQTHQAFNENKAAREENFDNQLEEIFKKNSASQEETSPDENNQNSGNYSFGNTKKEPSKKRSDGKTASPKTSTQSGGLRNSSISFSLVGRSAVNIPNPIYTCDIPGRIVVNITVNAQGRVTSTGINEASSSSNNECISEQAMEYAAQAVFSRLPGRDSQPGTITYNFKP